MKSFIGIGGLARAGKDTACNILVQKFTGAGTPAKRIALADSLKSEIRPKLIEQYGIDILNCTPEEKEKVRPELVAFGKERRLSSNGTFWTDLLESKAAEVEENVIIVPDVRYDVFEKDERYWIQDKMQGVLLHVSRYWFDGPDECPRLFKKWLTPPNEDEAENDPKIRAAADFVLSWETEDVNSLTNKYNVVFDGIVQHTLNQLKRANR